ncbi:MAG: molecular chaperone HtpG, partial [Gammaproteobacteria bacterium]
GEYTIERLDRPRRGTEVVLHLREGEDELLEPYRVRSIVSRYSDHISLPIMMAKQGEDETGMETVNEATALWTRNKRDIKDEEYNEFYKHVAHDFEDPLAHVHSRVEGRLEYTSLLYIPSRAPFDLYDRNHHRGVKLYVRRVFIMDDAEQLMPTYLRFVRGVIDSADLPLNVSREILQQNKQIESIRSGSVKKVLDLLGTLVEKESDKYTKFWEQFGRVLKEGIVEDAKNRDTIAGLLRFASTKGDGTNQSVSLADYISRMPETQDKIYYVTAESYLTARNSPHLEVFEARDIEVLLLTDEVDEWVVNHLTEFEDKKLQSVSRGELDLDDGEKKKDDDESDADSDKDDAKTASDHQALIDKLKSSLGDRVKDVRTTDRLTSSPACLVADEHDMGGHLQRILESAGQKINAAKPVLEVNAAHPIVQRIAADEDETRSERWASIIFDQALLAEGGKLEDPAGFVRRFNEVLLSVAEEGAAGGAKTAKPKRKTTAKTKRKTTAKTKISSGENARPDDDDAASEAK